MSFLMVGLCMFGDPAMKPGEQVLFPVQEHGRWGYIAANGKVIIKCEFTHAAKFYDGLARVSIRHEDEELPGFINTSGQFVIGPGPPPGYGLRNIRGRRFSYSDFHEGLAGFHIGHPTGRSGYIDKTGRVVIPVKFRIIDDFSEGLACVELLGKRGDAFELVSTGFIDKSGFLTIKLTDGFLGSTFADGRCCISIQNESGSWQSGFIDRGGTMIVPPKYDRAWDFSEGLACVRIGGGRSGTKGRYGFIGTDGEVRIPIEYDNRSSELFGNGRAIVSKNTKAVVIDTQGRVLADVRMDSADHFFGSYTDNRARVLVRQEGIEKWGFLDLQGKLTIPAVFDHVEPFDKGLAKVIQGDATGYIDLNGEYVWKTKAWDRNAP